MYIMLACIHTHSLLPVIINDVCQKKMRIFFEVDFLHLTTTSLVHRVVDVYLTNYSFQTSFHSSKMRETWMTWIRFKTVRTPVSGIPLLYRIIFPAHCDLIPSTSVSIYLHFLLFFVSFNSYPHILSKIPEPIFFLSFTRFIST